jgi:hypothetical protein
MPTATFVADFSKWNQAVKDATAGLKPLELQGKGVAQQLKSIQNSFSGATILKQANLAVAAIGDIKNVTKLTAQEQTKLNATVTEAIAKYAALGQKAPADMVALAKATKQSESALSGIGAALGPLAGLFAGAFAVGTIKNLAGDALKFASDLNDLSAKTGISVEALQEFKFAGDQVGVTLDDVSQAILGMQKHLVGDDKSAVAGLNKIGLSLKDLQGLHPEDQFSKIASALSKIEDPAVRNKAAFDIMGKSAAAVLPLIASDLDKTIQKARDLGVVLDQDAINKLDDLGDTWAAVKVAGEAFIAKALVPLAPAATRALNALLPLAAKIGELPALYIKAEIAALKYAKTQVDDAAKFLASPAGTFTNPIGKLTGQTDKEVFALHGTSLVMQNDLNQLQEELDNLGKAATNTHTPLAKFKTDLSDSGAGAKKVADDTDKLRDELNAVRDDILKVSGAIDKMFEKDQIEAARKETEALQKFTDAVNEMSGQSGLDKALFDLDALNAAMAQGGATADQTKKVYDELGVSIVAILSGGAHLTGTLEEQTAQWDKLTQAAADFSALHPIEPLKEELPKVIEKTEKWDKDIGELSHALADLAQISGGTFGKIFTGLSSIVGAANAGVKSIEGIGASMKAIKGADGTKDLAKGFVGLTTGILGAVSAAVAFGEALVKIFKKDRAKEEIGSVAKEFGETISKEFGQAIEDLAKNSFGGNRQAAKIFDLDQIISQGGGITSKNLGVLEDRLHDVFSLLQTGALSGDQAMSVLDKNFQTFVDYLGGNVDPALKNIIKLNDEFGLHSKAIAQYVDAQANSALSSLTKVVNARQAALDALNNAKTPEDTAKAQKQLNALPLTPGSGAAFGGALFGIFERLTKDGASVIDTLKQIDPVIESLDKQFAAAGISGGAAFDKIKSLAGIATDEIAGPSFEAIQNYGAALDALNNSNILDQETFTGLSDQITATYQAAVAALTAEGKDGSAALGLVAPDLQKIWELQQDFGYAVDDSTQALLDQAVAAGDVGEKHRSIQAQTLDVMKHLDTVLVAIGEKFGVTLPTDIDKTGKAFDDAKEHLKGFVGQIPDNIDIPVNVDYKSNQPPGQNDYQQGPPDQYSHPYSKGGMVYASGGFIPRGSDTVPAMLTPGEGVLSLSGMSALGRLNAGQSWGASPSPTVVILQIDKREIGRAIADVLPGEVRRLGVRVRT